MPSEHAIDCLADPIRKSIEKLCDSLDELSGEMDRDALGDIFSRNFIPLANVVSFLDHDHLNGLIGKLAELESLANDGQVECALVVEKLLAGLVVFRHCLHHVERDLPFPNLRQYASLYTVQTETTQTKRSGITEFIFPPDAKVLADDSVKPLAIKVLDAFTDNLALWLNADFDAKHLIEIRRCFYTLRTRLPDARLATGFWAAEVVVELLLQYDRKEAYLDFLIFFQKLTDVLEALSNKGVGGGGQSFSSSLMSSLVRNIVDVGNGSQASTRFIEHNGLSASDSGGKPADHSASPGYNFVPLIQNIENVFVSARPLVEIMGAQLKRLSCADSDTAFAVNYERLKLNIVRLLSVTTFVKDSHVDVFDSANATYALVVRMSDRTSFDEHAESLASLLVRFEDLLVSKWQPQFIFDGNCSAILLDGATRLICHALSTINACDKAILDYDEDNDSYFLSVLTENMYVIARLAFFLDLTVTESLLDRCCRVTNVHIQSAQKNTDLSKSDLYFIVDVLAKAESMFTNLARQRSVPDDYFASLETQSQRYSALKPFVMGWTQEEFCEHDDVGSELKRFGRDVTEIIDIPSDDIRSEALLKLLMLGLSLSDHQGISRLRFLLKSVIALIEASHVYEWTSAEGRQANDLILDSCRRCVDIVVEFSNGQNTINGEDQIGRNWIWVNGDERPVVPQSVHSAGSISVASTELPPEAIDDGQNDFALASEQLLRLLSQTVFSLSDINSTLAIFTRLHDDAVVCGCDELKTIYQIIMDRLSVRDDDSAFNQAAVCPVLIKIMNHIALFMKTRETSPVFTTADRVMNRLNNMEWLISTDFDHVTDEFISYLKEDYASVKDQVVWLINQSHHDERTYEKLESLFHILRGNAASTGLVGISEIYGIVESELKDIIMSSLTLNLPVVRPFFQRIFSIIDPFIASLNGVGSMLASRSLITEAGQLVWTEEAIVDDLVTEELIQLVKESFVTAKSQLERLLSQPTLSPDDVSNVRCIFDTLHGNALSCNYFKLARIYLRVESALDVVIAEGANLNLSVVCPTLIKVVGLADVLMRSDDRAWCKFNADFTIRLLDAIEWSVVIDDIELISPEMMSLIVDAYDETKTKILSIIRDENYSDDVCDALRKHFHTLKGNALSCNLGGVSEIYCLAELEFAKFLKTDNALNGREVFAYIERAFSVIDGFMSDINAPASMLASRALMSELNSLSWIEGESVNTGKPAVAFEPIYDHERAGYFLEEAAELMPTVTRFVSRFIDGTLDDEDSDELKRIMHNLKGAVNMVPSPGIAEIYHNLESIFEFDSTNEQEGLVSLTRLAIEELSVGLSALEDDIVFAPSPRLQICFEALNRHIVVDPDSVTVDAIEDKITEISKTEADSSPTEIVSDQIIEEILDAPNSLEIFLAQKKKRKKTRASKRISDSSELRIKTSSLDIITDCAIQTISSTARVKASLLTNSKTLKRSASAISELKKLHAKMADVVSDSGDESAKRLQALLVNSQGVVDNLRDDVDGYIENMASHEKTTDLLNIAGSVVRDEIAEARLVTIYPHYFAIEKQVKSVAEKEGKLLKLNPQGLNEKFDRALLTPIKFSIQHILTNAVTHGIEARSVRRAAGKGEVGLIRFVISQIKRTLQVVIQDDGGGISVERVLKKAIEKGIVKAGAQLSDSQIMRLIFSKALSTAESVGMDAGRGQGMYSVLNEVEAAGGTITIESELGVYTRFTITLNMSIGTRSVLRCVSGLHDYAIAHSDIDSMCHAKAVDRDGSRFIEHDGKRLQALDLADLAASTSTASPLALRTYILLRSEPPVAVGVDHITDMTDIVVHDVPAMLDAEPGFSGFVEDDTGVPVLVLDTQAILAKNYAVETSGALTLTPQLFRQNYVVSRPVAVVVDDRRSEAMLTVVERLIGLGFSIQKTQTVENGLRAIMKARPALVVVDCTSNSMDRDQKSLGFAANVLSENSNHARVFVLVDDEAGWSHVYEKGAYGVVVSTGMSADSIVLNVIDEITKCGMNVW